MPARPEHMDVNGDACSIASRIERGEMAVRRMEWLGSSSCFALSNVSA
jgi:hypothetical protein